MSNPLFNRTHSRCKNINRTRNVDWFQGQNEIHSNSTWNWICIVWLLLTLLQFHSIFCIQKHPSKPHHPSSYGLCHKIQNCIRKSFRVCSHNKKWLYRNKCLFDMDFHAAKFIVIWFVNTAENDKWRSLIGTAVHVHDKWLRCSVGRRVEWIQILIKSRCFDYFKQQSTRIFWIRSNIYEKKVFVGYGNTISNKPLIICK